MPVASSTKQLRRGTPGRRTVLPAVRCTRDETEPGQTENPNVQCFAGTCCLLVAAVITSPRERAVMVGWSAMLFATKLRSSLSDINSMNFCLTV